eukprot:gb/GFBE01061064.1/.p1 GENE.gb/GFBE01061064.1/~~gb/GFBE01061064.1/.p1  ORF type:complete len:566 (+),score=154.13 gb/GFBE01061064.1/:1-1698(+)
MTDVSDVSLKAVGAGDEKATLMLDLDTRRCGFIMAALVKGFEMEDIALDSKQMVITVASWEGIKGEDIQLKVFDDTPFTSYDLTGFDGSKKWLARVESMRPIEKEPGEDNKWRYITDKHSYRFEGNLHLHVKSFDAATRILTLRGVHESERIQMAELEKGRIFSLHGEDYGWQGVELVGSSDVSLKGVVVYQATGTAFDAWACHNVALTNCAVKRRGERSFSAAFGAISFRSCTGDLKVVDGEFEGYGYDSLSISNVYHQAESKDDSTVTFAPKPATPLPWAKGQAIVFQDSSSLEEVLRTTIVDVGCAADSVIPTEACTLKNNFTDWLMCCQGGWGKIQVTLKDSPAALDLSRHFAVLPDHVPESVQVEGNSFGQCRCKGLTVTGGDKTSILVKDNKIAATTSSAVFIENGPAKGRFMRMQGPFAKEILIVGNDVSVESERSEYSYGGYKAQWPLSEDDISVAMAPIVVGAVTSDANRANHIYKGSPLYGTVTIKDNLVKLGGMPSKCPKYAYCTTPYHWFPEFAIAVDSAETVSISGNEVSDDRLTKAGTPLVSDDCDKSLLE